ncbi:MAG: hypothetical protein MMC33_002608 [Icmadophila ericetorum]|nr:hypothetical protein [Icmadophila ericetorum]
MAMEPIQLQRGRPGKECIECWDDDEDLHGFDDIQFRNISTTTLGSQASNQLSRRRDSSLSRLSSRSEADSNTGADENWQLVLPNNDDAATSYAIASAQNAGIPIPANVPASALMGGTIKRLGGRRLKKELVENWSEDLELPKPEEGGLKLKMSHQDFPDTLRQISLAFAKDTSPVKEPQGGSFLDRMRSSGKAQATVSALEKFRDNGDEDFGDFPTIKVAKVRSPQKLVNFTPPPGKAKKMPRPPVENFEADFELPAEDQPLKLSARKELPRTPNSQQQDDLDAEWAEGSLGSLGNKAGGTRQSNCGSSFSAPSPSVFSPSLSSCLTAESEDELDGLVLPDGPLKFEEMLRKRTQNASPEPVEITSERKAEKHTVIEEDDLSGLEIGDGDVFDTGKLTLNKNIRPKATRQTSPVRRKEVTITFANKAQPIMTRIPKPPTHDRARSKLEPVLESTGSTTNYRRPQSRIGGHSTQSSISSIPTPCTPSFQPPSQPSTPSRRGLNNAYSRETMRADPITTHAQLLKAKRSLPVIKSQPSPARTQPSYQRPQSRTEHSSRSGLTSRPKTPSDRLIGDLGLSRKPPIPSLPTGTTQTGSHQINNKSSRTFRRPGSSDSNENAASNRPPSRMGNGHLRPITPGGRRNLAPEALTREATSKHNLTKPLRRRVYGDGNELEVFDDLPVKDESKLIKQPVITKKPSTLRNKLNSSQNPSTTSLHKTTDASVSATPLSPTKNESSIPRFARDTTASRLAREHRIGALHSTSHNNTTDTNSPLTPLSTNWKARVAARAPIASSPRHPPKRAGPPKKPHLITPLNVTTDRHESVNGMHWNPHRYRWEGNENAIVNFDPSPESPKHGSTGAGTLTSKPALIANFGSVKGVQVVGGMVFDPQRMCWLKMAPQHQQSHSNSHGGCADTQSICTADEEDDVFAGLEDLDDSSKASKGGKTTDTETITGSQVEDDWLVGEEFDVGPEFIRRQRAEEERWVRKVDGWVGEGAKGRVDGEEWKWRIREIVGAPPALVK